MKLRGEILSILIVEDIKYFNIKKYFEYLKQFILFDIDKLNNEEQTKILLLRTYHNLQWFRY